MTALPHLYRHHRWANLALIDALAALPAEVLTLSSPGTYGTIHETLAHLVEAEERYLAALNGAGTIVARPPAEPLALPVLREAALRQADALVVLAGQVGEETTVRGTFNGRPFDAPAFVPLFQAYNHGAEHRTNITTILAAHAHAAPPLDLWTYMAAGLP